MSQVFNKSVPSSKSSDNITEQRLAKAASQFKPQLDALGCPFTENVDDWWIVELIFKPGEPRIRLLQWLFVRLNSKLNELLDPDYGTANVRMDSRLQRILYVASTMGLCRPDDIDLIRGVSSTTRQLSFISHLLDIVSIADSAAQSNFNLSATNCLRGNAPSISEQFSCDCCFLDMLEMQPRLDKCHTKLLPPDIMKQLKNDCKADQNDPYIHPLPDMKSLEETADKCEQDLEKLNRNLEKVKASYQTSGCAPQQNAGKAMKLALSELHQLMAGFCCCFDSELHMWCGPSARQHNALGATFKRTHALLDLFVKLLNSLASMNTSHTELCRRLATDIENTKKAAAVSGDQSAVDCSVDTLQQYIRVLDDAMRAAVDCLASRPSAQQPSFSTSLNNSDSMCVPPHLSHLSVV